MNTEGKKYDAGKTAYALLPRVCLRGVALVMTFGAAKYADDSWQNVPDGLRRYRSAAERHFDAVVLDGEVLDHESGIEHAWHYLTNHMFVAWLMILRPDQVGDYAQRQVPPNTRIGSVTSMEAA